MDNYKQKYERLVKSIKDLYPYMLADCKKEAEEIILELEMGEDEKIRKGLIDFLESPFVNENITDEKVTPWIDWLEKQGKETQDPCEKCNHPMLNCYNFPCIQKKAFDQGKTILDVMNKEKVDNQNCVKPVWSEDDEKMLNRCIFDFEYLVKHDSFYMERYKEQVDWLKSLKERVQPQNFTVTDVLDKIEYHSGEPTPDDKVEPKFRVDDWVVQDKKLYQIEKVTRFPDNHFQYWTTDGVWFGDGTEAHLWTIQDAKDGDVLYSLDSKQPFIYKKRPQFSQAIGYCCINEFGKFSVWNTSKCVICTDKYIPATKEQRDLLFQKMIEAGYEWDAEKKELKGIVRKVDMLPKGEDYGIDGLWHATQILERTVGEVEGYQSDDGILEHRCAIEAVKRLYNQKHIEWSEEDELQMQGIIDLLSGLSNRHNWLKSLKERVQSQNFTVTDEELAQAKKDAYNNALDKIEYHSGKPTFDDGWSAAIDFFQKKSLRPCCAKLLEKQGEQKPADKAESKFKAGDFITDGRRVFLVLANKEERNLGETYSTYCEGLLLDVYGDVLVDGKDFSSFKLATDIERVNFAHDLKVGTRINYKPADLPNGEDYDIDSLGHAIQILEKTIGQVDGYRISEHKRAIEAVTRVYKRKSNIV